MGVIVETLTQEKRVLSDILTLIDRKDADLDSFSFLLCLERTPNISANISAIESQKVINENSIKLSLYMFKSPEDDLNCRVFKELNSCFFKRFQYKSEIKEKGRSWLWIQDNTHPITRSLLRSGQCFVSEEGRYLVEMPEIFSFVLREQERYVQDLSLELQK